jgi:hypothetical protein
VAKIVQHRHDIWTEFPSESDGITTSSSTKSSIATSAGDGSLALFPSEAAAEVSEVQREPIAEPLTSFSSESTSTESHESFVSRWVVPAAAGIVFGMASLVVTLYVLNRWNQQDPAQLPMMIASDGVPANLLASMGRIAIVVPARIGNLPPRANTTRVPLAGGVEPPAGDVVTSAPAPREISLSPEALTTLPGDEITDDELAVRSAIRSYEQAYERVDAAAIARVWPTVDQRALSQAFDAVTSQGIGLEHCAIALNGEQATAQCRGRHKYVGKANNSVTIASEQQWLFKMRRAGGQWKIEDVSPSQVAALTTAGRGQN